MIHSPKGWDNDRHPVVVLLVVIIIKLSKNKLSARRCCEVNCQP